MNASKHRFNVIDGTPAQPAPRREVAFASIVAAILLLGAVGATFSSQIAVDPAPQSANGTPQPAQEFIYFPSQYVNQGSAIPEPLPTF